MQRNAADKIHTRLIILAMALAAAALAPIMMLVGLPS